MLACYSFPSDAPGKFNVLAPFAFSERIEMLLPSGEPFSRVLARYHSHKQHLMHRIALYFRDGYRVVFSIAPELHITELNAS